MEKQLITELRILIDTARKQALHAVNSELVVLYWNIGMRIRLEILQEKRAKYGNRVIKMLGDQLRNEYGSGFAPKSLRHMVRFASIYSDQQIVSTVSRQLSWSHLLEIVYLPDAAQRQFYIAMCSEERWSVRRLRERKSSLLYERSIISQNRTDVTASPQTGSGSFHPNLILKDPYILDFLGLRDHYLEKDLEDAVLREIEEFLLELGTGFSFIARQKRLQIDEDDFYIDLLLYNRKLRRLVVVDLKIGEFRAEHKGQMELYLRWLEKHELVEGELPPLGIILCTGKKHEQIELLELDKSGIHVAEYLTVLPPKEVLQAKMTQSIELARERLSGKHP
jgi:predicted nuclease of restriction endonuclease-like (RecB) superfamily